MNWSIVAAALLASFGSLVAGAITDTAAPKTRPGVRPTLTFNQRTYSERTLSFSSGRLGGAIGEGELETGRPREEPRIVLVRRLRGISPLRAVAVGRDRSTIYVRGRCGRYLSQDEVGERKLLTCLRSRR